MNRAVTHPAPSELSDLLKDRLAGSRQEEVVTHLDECAECQALLESLAGGAPGIAMAQVGGDRPERDSAFWPAMQALESSYDLRTPSETPPPHAAGRREGYTANPTPPPIAAKERNDAPKAQTPNDTNTVLDVPTSLRGAAISLQFLSPTDEPGMLGKLGDFNIVEVIGQGGMGIVLKALDVCLQRHVAIKVLDPQVAQNEIALQRFCREARAAAAITHENVVAVHQVQHDEGKDLPYLVMQYVAGETLQDRLDREGPLPLLEIVRIGMQTAAGLAAAHAQGLIHRDIKPANILLEEGTGHVRLTDFGLARAVEDAKLTQTGFVAGTPLYMAPEQAQGGTVDHRTDLFSLGSVLYAMCTGQPPFAGSTPFVVLRSVTEETPKPVREVNPTIPDWLEDLIERMLAKKPEERWQSASDLVVLLRQKLVELLAASPSKHTPSLPVRAVGSRRVTRGLLIWARVGQALTALLVILAITEAIGWTRLLNRRGTTGPQEVAFSPQHLKSLNANVGPIWSAALSADGKTLFMGIEDGTIKLWDVDTGRVKATINAHAGPVWTIAFTEQGDRFATSSDDGTAKIWDGATNKEIFSLPHESGIRPLAFSPNGDRLVSGTRNGKLVIWDARTGSMIEKFQAHPGVIMSLAYAKDGKTIASASGDKTIKLWDAQTRQEQVTLRGHSGGVYSVAISPDGKTIASGSWDRTVRTWDADTGNQRQVLTGHLQGIWAIAFSPDGATVASAGDDRVVKIWETATGKEISTFRGHSSTIYAVTFSRRGDMLASGGREGAVSLWSVP